MVDKKVVQMALKMAVSMAVKKEYKLVGQKVVKWVDLKAPKRAYSMAVGTVANLVMTSAGSMDAV
jgi:hypothetical protein